MTRHFVVICGVALTSLFAEQYAAAQMFGPRSMGRPLSLRQGQAEIQSAGTLLGNERFLRANRRATDFVGPDIREMRGFVGSVQARGTGTVRPSTEGIRRRVDRSVSVNQPAAAAPRGRPYNPRLSLPYDAPLVNENYLAENILDLLAKSSQVSGTSRIAVLVEGRTAILQGEVLGAKDRDLVQLLVSFEPGISEIQNELVVNPRLRRGPNSLAVRRKVEERKSEWVTLSHPAQTRSPESDQ